MKNLCCWDDFNSSLTLSPSLRAGLVFVDNCLSGVPMNGSSWQQYTVSSQKDVQSPFALLLGSTAMMESLSCSLRCSDNAFARNECHSYCKRLIC